MLPKDEFSCKLEVTNDVCNNAAKSDEARCNDEERHLDVSVNVVNDVLVFVLGRPRI